MRYTIIFRLYREREHGQCCMRCHPHSQNQYRSRCKGTAGEPDIGTEFCIIAVEMFCEQGIV